MSPEERQLIAGLFERTKSAASTPRDQEAEAFISEQIKAQPAAPYLLAQTVMVQDQALQGANARIEELEARVQELNPSPPAVSSAACSGVVHVPRRRVLPSKLVRADLGAPSRAA